MMWQWILNISCFIAIGIISEQEIHQRIVYPYWMSYVKVPLTCIAWEVGNGDEKNRISGSSILIHSRTVANFINMIIVTPRRRVEM